MFGKKKKNDAPEHRSNDKALTRAEKKAKKKTEKENKKKAEKNAADVSKKTGKKKFFTIKKIVIFLIFLCVASASGFFTYKKYFAAKGKDAAKKYTSVKLKYISLPDEILEFTFNNFPALYASFINFNRDIIFVDKKIERIKDVGKRYPTDKNIADKEGRIWIKARDKGLKNFKKIERKTEAVYVLFQVNREKGVEKIKEEKKDLESSAMEALKPLDVLTEKLKIKTDTNAPKGFIKGTIYKIRKKIGF